MKKITIHSILSFSVAFLLFACDQKTASSDQQTTDNTATSTAAVPTSSQSTPATDVNATSEVAKMEFDAIQHDFGNLKEGDIVKHTYKFKNVGTAPLIISNVQVQCGCTTPSYTKTPVPPNSEGSIELQFDSSGKAGPQHKTATIFANVEGGQTQLVLTATVAAKPKIDGPYLKQ
jgi:hypothetical protein